MTWKEWLASMLHGTSYRSAGLKAVKQKLTRRQLEVADRLADMKGVTRDEVLAEAYRRADRFLKPR